ncbi:MAG: acetyltransferase component of pyruvate dehydrogenase complex [Betaproteobacteria bacterium]|nr:MAG: acetyltransferase component of pyruvate dehydrogenase complex [Betaproteobacteria bacterium]
MEVKVPDIGGYENVPVIEVFVKPGDAVRPEDPLVTLESDKATMDVPAPAAGTVKEVRVTVGDKVSEGSVVLVLDTAAAAAAPADEPRAAPKAAPPAYAPPPEVDASAAAERAPRGEKGLADAPGEGATTTPPAGATVEVRVPDIGGYDNVPVIEVFVKPGDVVAVDDPLVTLESDKATMDVPSPLAGAVQGVRVTVGDRVSEGSVIVSLSVAGVAAAPPPARPPAAASAAPASAPGLSAPAAAPPQPAPAPATAAGSAPPRAAGAPPVADEAAFRAAHASPAVRKFARELGVDLAKVAGSGPKGRITQEDVQSFVKRALAAPASPAGAGGVAAGGTLDLLPWPKVDFAKWGDVEAKPLSRIRKISGANLARNWVMIPHVTQFDDADITELEALRVALNKEHEKAGVKLTMLAFLIKASVAALRRFPDFNASLDGESLVYKKYFNVGFAADTPNGLVVPVIKNADQKGVLAIAKEMGELSAKAREGKLGPADMQGGSFSISSLGGIGGTAFTPIINAPEVAILGVSRSVHKPVWDGKAFVPRLVLPLSLSYDHRVIDGAAAARFTSYLATLLADMRRVLL